MKVFGERFVFDGEPPQPPQIATAVSRLSGLEVCVSDELVLPPELGYWYRARIAFKCSASEAIIVFYQRPRGYRAIVVDQDDPRAQALLIARDTLKQLRTQQCDSPPSSSRLPGEVVRLSDPQWEEPTLRIYVCRALELLGGVEHSTEIPDRPAGPISPEELHIRMRQLQQKQLRSRLIGYLLLPFLAVYMLLLIPWAFWSARSTIRKLRENYLQY